MSYRSYCFKEIDGNNEEVTIQITEFDVLDIYWEQWIERQPDRTEPLDILEEECIVAWIEDYKGWQVLS